MSGMKVPAQPVVIAVDPHKASWTAAAVGAALAPLDTLRAPVSRQGYRQLRRFAARWPGASWAIEGASGLGAPLAALLAKDGIVAADVPAKLATRVRMLSTGHGRKNDDADAVSVGIAALTAPGLRSATVEQAILALRALVEHRDDVVRTRTQTVNRLHVLLTQLLPGGAPRSLTADIAAQLLRGVRPREAGPRALRRIAAELTAEIRHLDRRIDTTTNDISAAVAASATTLTQLRGLGDLTAAKIVARLGDLNRFRSEAAFASYTPHRSLLRRRHPAQTLPSRGPPTEQLSAHDGAQPDPARLSGQALLPAQTGRRQEQEGGPTVSETTTVRRGLPPTPTRCPSNAGGESGRTPGGDYRLQRGRLNPYHRLFGQVTSRTRRSPPYSPQPRST